MFPIDESTNDPLALIALPRLMALTEGRRDTRIGLIDGPVMGDHPDFADASISYFNIQDVSPVISNDGASLHATSVAGMLVARRGSVAPAICPGVTLLVRPISHLVTSSHHDGISEPDELASAIVETVDAEARILNLSLALVPLTTTGHHRLKEALDYALRRDLIVVAAAGNQGTIGSSVITRHPSVIPVVAYDLQGRPASASNLGHSIGRRGLGAPGEGITSLGTQGGSHRFGGTSAAAAFVTGALALLWSEFPEATSADLRFAVRRSTPHQRSIIPPLLNAWGAYEALRATRQAEEL